MVEEHASSRIAWRSSIVNITRFGRRPRQFQTPLLANPPSTLTRALSTSTSRTQSRASYAYELLWQFARARQPRPTMSRRPNPAADRAEQNRATLKNLVKLEGNKTCADCKRNKRMPVCIAAVLCAC